MSAPEAEPSRPTRYSLSALHAQALDALRGRTGEHHSVELVRNARGDTQIRVSVRTGESGIETPEDASARAQQLYDHLRSVYPLTETPGSKVGE